MSRLYHLIAQHYNELFPGRDKLHTFIREECGSGVLLDIGCATGTLASALVRDGFKVIGIDIDTELLEQANESVQQADNPEFKKGDMTELCKDFQPGRFNAIICVGNVLPHMPDLEHVAEFCAAAFSLTGLQGKLILQFLNHDALIEAGAKELPVLETESIRFKRTYTYSTSENCIVFTGEVTEKANGQVHTDEIKHTIIRPAVLEKMILQAGWKSLTLFGNSNGQPFEPGDSALIGVCRKVGSDTVMNAR